MEKINLSLDQLGEWVRGLSKTFSNKQLVLLSGPLGAGKTEFVKTILNNFGCEEVNSPTYGLIHEYPAPLKDRVFHIDLYRLKDEEDLESSGFWDLFENDQGLIFVEWADKLPRSVWPLHWDQLLIDIELQDGMDARLYNVHKLSND